MEHYTDLAFRYIKMNKRRSVLTILGVVVAVTLLYALLNLLWSYLLNYRDWLRDTKDYEIVIFTENGDAIDNTNMAEDDGITENTDIADSDDATGDTYIAEDVDNADDSMALIDKILNDPRIKDGTVADYYKYDYYNPVTYKNSLYLNTTNPYRMEEILDGLKNDYGVDGILHKEMAATYIQGDEGEYELRLTIGTAHLHAKVVCAQGK